MRIRITAGGADMPPMVYVFEYAGPDDEVLLESVAHIRNMLEKGRRININQTLLLVCAKTASMLGEGADTNRISGEVAGMLPEETVMIGVRPMTHTLDLCAEMETRCVSFCTGSPVAARGHGVSGYAQMVPQDMHPDNPA